ncbi:MAG: threonylcarbamoyl-AMP synthase [Clostridia bacterium]|nr:threonylcarbamoyl-AMP synthase [Clostridia bacterium]
METKIVKITDPRDTKITEMGEIIRNGGLVSFPTETVYGLGANAFDEKAVLSVFVAKNRPADNPLIVHLADISELETVARDIPDAAYKLFREFSPGPLTIILKKKDTVPDVVSAGLDTVAVRIPSHPIAQALIRAAGVPIAAPSSNLSGRPSPTRAEHVIEDMKGRIPAIIDGGACSVGVESTVIELTTGTVNILRPGGITKSDLGAVLENVTVDRHVTEMVTDGETPKSPGMKYKHYAPDAEVTVLVGDTKTTAAEIKQLLNGEKGAVCGVMCYDGFAFDCETVLYMGEDNKTYAERLFDALRQCDALGVKKVFAQFSEDENYGLAVRNRLFKAAAGRVIIL